MSNKVIQLLKGRFLINENALKNWGFIIYSSILGFIMIASSHRLDYKVHRVYQLNEEVKKLRSQYVETTSLLQKLTLKTTLVHRLRDRKIGFPRKALKKITVKVPE